MKILSRIIPGRHTSDGELFSEFTEASVEMPSDGLNGDCIVHYGGEHSKFSMRVKLVNGKRDGMAILIDHSRPFLLLEYKDGILSGNLVDYDDYHYRIWRKVFTGMEVIDESLSIDICDSLSSVFHYLEYSLHHVEDCLAFYDLNSGSEYAVIRVNERHYATKRGKEEKYVVEVDLNRHDMRYWQDDHWILIPHGNQCIDLDVNGRRWEGGVNNCEPFGFGVLFDDEGRIEYEGFMVNGLKMCYGQEYYSDIERIEYDGYFCGDKRFGKGIPLKAEQIAILAFYSGYSIHCILPLCFPMKYNFSS